jgi:hypothetical protein
VTFQRVFKVVSRAIWTALVLSGATMVLSGGGCVSFTGGDGLSGGGGDGGAKTFTSFSAVVAGEDTEMEAETRVADYTANMAGQVTSVGASERKDGTFTFALGSDFTKASLSIPPGPGFGSETNISFDTADGDSIILGALFDPVATGYYVAESAGLDERAVISDHNLMGFEYQSYGVWINGIDVGMGTIAAMTAGAATPASGVPVAGLALYNGSSTGFYVDPAGDAFLAFADFSAAVSFDTLLMNVASTNTQVLDVNSLVTSANSALDYAGVGAVALDGSFITAIAATDLAGTLDGKLYGPSAEELGGTFDMSGLNGSYIGAVGAAQ